MMNSPYAILMTPICPKVRMSPRAMSSSTAPMLTPVKDWLRTTVMRRLRIGDGRSQAGTGGARRGARGSGEDGGPVVALEVRVRLDRRARVPHLGDQAVRADLPDARRLVD